MNNYKCHFCPTCNGTGCIGQMPGMGGVNRNINFRLNCDGWEVLRKENPLLFINFLERPVNERIPDIRLAPITGAVENIGFETEKDWYLKLFSAAHSTGLKICVGDGCPDEKIKYGIEAVKKLQKKDKDAKAAFFIKPFENKKIFLTGCNLFYFLHHHINCIFATSFSNRVFTDFAFWARRRERLKSEVQKRL